MYSKVAVTGHFSDVRSDASLGLLIHGKLALSAGICVCGVLRPTRGAAPRWGGLDVLLFLLGAAHLAELGTAQLQVGPLHAEVPCRVWLGLLVERHDKPATLLIELRYSAGAAVVHGSALEALDGDGGADFDGVWWRACQVGVRML